MFVHEVWLVEETKLDGEDVIRTTGYSQMDVKGYIPVSMINLSAANNYYKYLQIMAQILNAQKGQ